MAINWELLEAQGIRRTGNRGRGSPRAFLIVGIDVSEEDLLGRFANDPEAQAIIRKGGKDTARLADEIPGWFVRNMETGKPPPIHIYQLLEENSKGETVRSWPITIDGRSRLMVLRKWVDEGKRRGDASKDREVDAEVHAYNKAKGAGIWALRLKSRMNQSIPESLAVKAERAADFFADGIPLVKIADEIGVDYGEDEKAIEKGVKGLLRWHELFKDLCVEARAAANKGELRLGAAVRLAKLSKSEQKERLEGNRPAKKKSSRPLSPRTLGIFTEQAAGDSSVPPGFVALLRLMNGDRTAIDKLPAPIRAAWLRTEEAAKQKARRT